jgi:hypothetical protein
MMQGCSAHGVAPDGSIGNTIDGAIAADDVKLSSDNDGPEAPRMQAQSVIEMQSFPVHKPHTGLNPLGSMFHLFISYRAATDSKLSLDLHDRLQVLSTSDDFKIPLLSRTKRPKEFKPSMHTKGLHIFLDARCLSDGDQWRGDGTSCPSLTV